MFLCLFMTDKRIERTPFFISNLLFFLSVILYRHELWEGICSSSYKRKRGWQLEEITFQFESHDAWRSSREEKPSFLYLAFEIHQKNKIYLEHRYYLEQKLENAIKLKFHAILNDCCHCFELFSTRILRNEERARFSRDDVTQVSDITHQS